MEQNNKKSIKLSGKLKWICVMVLFFLAAALFTAGTMILRKELKINPIFARRYEIHGVDVSHYQGTIDWETLYFAPYAPLFSANKEFVFMQNLHMLFSNPIITIISLA